MSKENSKKRIREITAFAAALLMVGAFSVPAGTEIMGVRLGNAVVASADTIISADGNYAYVVNSDNDDTVTITGYNGSGGAVEIPSGIDGKTVTAIGDSAFKSCTSLESITIPNSVNSIGNSAFKSCTSLESITIPDSITSIGHSAFYSCTSLTSITIPGGVTSIENEAFYKCENLGSVTFGENSQLSSIGEYAFQFCNITSITIPNSVTSIKRAAFYGCRNLTDIIFPSNSGFTSIENQVFQNCTSLESITIPGSVTSIRMNAFLYCSSLKRITIPGSVTSIEGKAFNGCTSLESIFLPESASIGTDAIPNAATQVKYTVSGDNVTVTDISMGNQAALTIPDTIGGKTVTAVFIKDGTTGVDVPAAATQIKYTVSEDNKVTVTEATLGDGKSSFTIPDTIGGKAVAAVFIKDGTTDVVIPAAATQIKYTVSDYNVTISGATAGTANVSVVIPETIGGKSVDAIGNNAFYSCTSLTSITIPDRVTSIGKAAFGNCTGLTSITIPDSVTSIGDYVFNGCSSLQSITIPNSVGSIGNHAFVRCTSLESITLPTNSGFTSIGDNAFEGCTSLASITIPDGVEAIGDFAFSGCTSLESITLPTNSGFTSIGESAFGNCTGLTSITIPDSVTSIGIDAFFNCTSLASIFIPDGLNVSSANIPDTATQVKYTVDGDNVTISGATAGTAKVSVVIPETIGGKNVTSIGFDAFRDCTSLTSITIPNSVTSIGCSAFSGCTNLTSIKLPTNVGFTSIVHSCFEDCTSLESITIPNSVISIENCAFSGCTSLASITIPNSVTSIGNSAFLGCTSLASITIPKSVTSIEGIAFDGCTKLAEITVDTNNTKYSSQDGVLFNKDKSTLLRCPENISAVTYVIPNSVTSISTYAFWNCSSLTGITIPNGVESIGYAAFANCSSLTSAAIPNSVTSIGDFAFENCFSLTSIFLPENLDVSNAKISAGTAQIRYNIDEEGYAEITGAVLPENTALTIPESINGVTVTAIANGAFTDCAELKSIVLPESINYIGDCSFDGCTSLESITIPDNVTYVGYAAFGGCTSLESVSFGENSCLEEIGGYAFNNCEELSEMLLPDSVTSIGGSAFEDCTGLDVVIYPADVSYTGENAIPETISQIKYTVEDGKTTVTEVTLGTSKETLDLPDDIFGKSFSLDEEALVSCPDIEHTHSEKTAATCTEKPVCSICGQGYGEALGHDNSGDWQKNGTEHWKVCARNDCTEILDKASHDYDEGVITTQPTEETEGVKTYTCETCGYTETEAIPVLEPSNPDVPDEPSIPDDPAEKVNSFVERLYENVLGRPSDPSKESHIDNLNNGETATKVAYDFVFSPEFTELDISNAERVTIMYNTFLNRDPDPAGLETWTKALDNGCSIGHIFYGFTQSGEFGEICEEYGIEQGTWEYTENRDKSAELTSFVSRLYTKALNRSYDVNGLNDHTGSYLEDHDLYQMAYNFIFSQEFIEMDLSDEDFVDTMYRTFFDREADPDGRADWLGRLKSGCSREEVLAGFVGSQECSELVARFGI